MAFADEVVRGECGADLGDDRVAGQEGRGAALPTHSRCAIRARLVARCRGAGAPLSAAGAQDALELHRGGLHRVARSDGLLGVGRSPSYGLDPLLE